MSWLAVLLIGLSLADLAHSVRPSRAVNAATGASGAIAVGLLAGLTEPRDVVALLVIAGVVVAWAETVRRGFGRTRAGLPLLVLGASVTLAIVLSGWAGAAGGVLGDWLDTVELPLLDGLSADRALLLAGVLGTQLSTGNVVVRLVLTATGTVHPGIEGQVDDDEVRLKGGRLLGPMERLVIVGLGLAGSLTAASIVIAAKGLLRFPELSSKSEQVRIHQLTEYFLVGSFVSWLVAFAGLLLAA